MLASGVVVPLHGQKRKLAEVNSFASFWLSLIPFYRKLFTSRCPLELVRQPYRYKVPKVWTV